MLLHLSKDIQTCCKAAFIYFYIHFLVFIFLPLGASRTRWIHSNNNGLSHCGNIFSKSVYLHMNIHLESSLFGHTTNVSPLSSLCLSQWTAERNMSCLHPSGAPLCSPASWSLTVCVWCLVRGSIQSAYQSGVCRLENRNHGLKVARSGTFYPLLLYQNIDWFSCILN